MTPKSRAERRATYRANSRARNFAGLTHGNPNTYSAGCRCDPCKAAIAASIRLYRASKRHEHGSLELAAAGCGCPACQIAAALFGDAP